MKVFKDMDATVLKMLPEIAPWSKAETVALGLERRMMSTNLNNGSFDTCHLSTRLTTRCGYLFCVLLWFVQSCHAYVFCFTA